jgi:hypothetical protein
MFFRQAEKAAGGPRRAARELFERFAARPCHHSRDVRKISGLVPSRRRFRMQVAWQQVRTIGFEHESIRGNLAHQRHEVRAAPLVVDPSGDADRETELEIGDELVPISSEAMRDGTVRESAAMLAEYRDEVCVRVTLMQEHWLANTLGNFKLARERFSLDIARGKVAEVIQAAFADCDGLRMASHLFERARELCGELRCVMRMYAGRGKQAPRMQLRKLERLV